MLNSESDRALRAYMHSVQEATSMPQLTTEARFLADLMLRNRNQHRRCDYYTKLCAVHRAAKQLQALQLPQLFMDLRAIMRASAGHGKRKSSGA